MNDKIVKQEPTQKGHINLAEPGEIRYWAEHFRSTDPEIIEAVKRVGGSVEAVKKHLRK